jgi:hypothetical protein
MITETNELTEKIGTVDIEYYRAYFGKDSDYYLPIMRDFYHGKKFTFNVWAFILGLFWQLYRRLYLPILFFITVIIVQSVIQAAIISYLDLSELTRTLMHLIDPLIFALIYGFTGNYFLMRKAHKKTLQILSAKEDEETILQKLEKAGSGNSTGVIVCIVSIIAFIAMIMFYKFQAGPSL